MRSSPLLYSSFPSCPVRSAQDRVNGGSEGRGVGEIEAFHLFDSETGVERGGVDINALRDAFAPDHLRAEQTPSSIRDEARPDL
jgi:hypothetical protein